MPLMEHGRAIHVRMITFILDGALLFLCGVLIVWSHLAVVPARWGESLLDLLLLQLLLVGPWFLPYGSKWNGFAGNVPLVNSLVKVSSCGGSSELVACFVAKVLAPPLDSFVSSQQQTSYY
ncbi:expressed unknown protein [Seminavis robusta]|uniref:Uncharacterized protein n=1 Tax=Seminavis robusta TaxID=568900 RepID=A0A9N8HZH8_9STRA|nr:expressed unknown protein [Seminavis robusta]|eukprot:Sro2285_g321950.1 n/a (121) ;mRNA; r:6985-7753